MKVRDIITGLKIRSTDANLGLTRVLAVHQLTVEIFEVRLDFPIIGLAHSGDDALLVVDDVSQFAYFDKVLRFGDNGILDIIGGLQGVPLDANLELSRVLPVPQLQVRLDFPITGLAHSGDDILLVVEYAYPLTHFGKVLRFGKRVGEKVIEE